LIRPNQGEAELANAVAFWGNLDFAPNRAAVEYFCTEVFLPYLRTTGTLFFVIGSNPSPELVRLSRMEPAIRVLGFVDDLFGLVARIPVVVNPLISGTGLKNKVLEAFALGRAVVSTSLGMEAIEAINGDHFVAADDPKTFAAAVSGLLAAPQERSRLGANARAFVLQRYTWESIGGEWVQLAAEAMGGQ
jgi:glycosyltransferase involved in cell wall biosynthesis